MKKLQINAIRGPVMDTQALYEALDRRSIAGTALNVMAPESSGKVA